MSTRSPLTRGMDVVGGLLVLVGLAYAVAIYLTPLTRADLYTGAPVVYLALVLSLAGLLLIVGLALLVVAFALQHPQRQRMALAYGVGAALFAGAFAVARWWIALVVA